MWLQETTGLSTAWKSWVSLARSETFILVIGSTLCSWSCGMYSPKALLLPVLGCNGQKVISIVRIEISRMETIVPGSMLLWDEETLRHLGEGGGTSHIVTREINVKI